MHNSHSIYINGTRLNNKRVFALKDRYSSTSNIGEILEQLGFLYEDKYNEIFKNLDEKNKERHI
ncbi:hypothetical protein [Oceanobacillus neutriphilus]|uniref:Uncharacterized protein n=1 Tax=Oceanobacillus neutriphilus TaxID=531815 RepID=A0ABQ2NS48_9BACI|nr:hypothetical protein [Oceanobacillus neutriphilus]GGP08879.1 hypothetical protein GCM10011346_10960 [Oceanobacillus neutriphilus]